MAAPPQPAARPRGPPARPRRVGRGPGRQAATPNGGGAHWAAGPGGARPPLGRALPAAAARASPADCLPASPQWAACRSPASWRRLGGGRTLGGRPRLGARPRLQQLTRPALSPAPPPQPGAQRPPRGKSRPPARQSCLPYAHWLTATPVNAAGLTGEIPSRPPAQPAVAARVHLLPGCELVRQWLCRRKPEPRLQIA